MSFQKFTKGVARITRTFRVEAGPFRAQGPPALLVALTGLIAAAGMARALAKTADRFPETLREARSLVVALRGTDPPRLRS